MAALFHRQQFLRKYRIYSILGMVIRLRYFCLDLLLDLMGVFVGIFSYVFKLEVFFYHLVCSCLAK